MAFSRIKAWVTTHPGKAGALAGWYQQACNGLAAIVVFPLIVKHLSEIDAGVWFSFQTLLGAVTLTDFGISFVLSRQVAYSLHTSGEKPPGDFIPMAPGWAGISELYAAGRQLFQLLSLVGLVVLAILFHLVLPATKLGAAINLGFSIPWYLLGIATLLSLQVKVHQAVIDGMGFVYLPRLVLGTCQLLSGIGVIVVLLQGGNSVGMAIIVFCASLIQFVVIRFLAKRLTSGRITPVRASRGLKIRLLKVSGPMGLINLSAFLVSSVQVPLLGMLLGPKAVPGFFLAQKIGQTLNMAVMNVINPQMPFFTQSIAREDWASATRRMQRMIAGGTLLACIVNAVFVFVTPPFVEWWVGPGKYVTPATLVLLTLDYTILAAAVFWGHFVFASGQNPFVVSTVLNGALNLTLTIILCSAFGVIGAPAASLTAGLLTNYWYTPFKGVQLLQGLKRKQSTAR